MQTLLQFYYQKPVNTVFSSMDTSIVSSMIFAVLGHKINWSLLHLTLVALTQCTVRTAVDVAGSSLSEMPSCSVTVAGLTHLPRELSWLVDIAFLNAEVSSSCIISINS